MTDISKIISQLQRWTLYLFFFSINFEVWSLFGLGVSIAKITGIAYFFTILPEIGFFLRTEKILKLIQPILILFLIITVISFFYVNNYSDDYFDLTILLNIILFWVLLNHERKSPLILEKGMFAFALGSVVLACFYLIGIGVENDFGRLTLFGDNQNTIGIRMVVSISVLIMLVIQNRLAMSRSRYLLLVPVPIMLNLLFETGSRVSFVAIISMFLVGLAIIKTESHKQKILALAIGMVVLMCGWTMMMKYDVLVGRLLEVTNEANIGPREVIWQKLIPFIIDNPVIGLGITGYEEYAYHVFGNLRSPHNVILEVLCFTGTIGLMFYAVFIVRIFKIAYLKYKNEGILLPFLLIFLVIGMLFSSHLLTVKIGWCVFAYMSAEAVVYREQNEEI